MSAVVNVLLVAQLAEVCLEKGDFFLLGLHQSSMEVVNLGAQHGVSVIRLFITTVIGPSSFDIRHLRFAECVNFSAVLFVLVAVHLSLFSHLDG